MRIQVNAYSSRNKRKVFIEMCNDEVGRVLSVGIGTRYGLDGLGIEPQWEQDIPHPFREALGLTSLLYNRYRVSFLGLKRPVSGVNHPPPSVAEVTEGIGLYLFSPSGRLPLPFCNDQDRNRDKGIYYIFLKGDASLLEIWRKRDFITGA
jgi:hypothetical protein